MEPVAMVFASHHFLMFFRHEFGAPSQAADYRRMPNQVSDSRKAQAEPQVRGEFLKDKLVGKSWKIIWYVIIMYNLVGGVGT